MATLLAILLVVFVPPLQTAAPQTTSAMQADVDRLVDAAERLTESWPSQSPPAIPEVAIVARHGKAVVPRDQGVPRAPWTVQAQVRSDRYCAAHLLGDLQDPRGVDLPIPLLNDDEVGYIVPWSLAEIGDRRAIGPLIGQLERDDPSVRVLAIHALETLNAHEALPRLRQLTQDHRMSNFGGRTTVAEAARRAIVAIAPRP